MADQLTGLGTISEILRIKPDWIEEIANELEMSRQILEFPGTIQELVTISQDAPARISCGFTFQSKADEYELIAFFAARQGRLSPFWFPLPKVLFTLVGTQYAGATFLFVRANSFVEDFQEYERIYIEKTNGDLCTFEILSAVKGSSEDDPIILYLGAALTDTIEEEDILRVSLLYLVRFDMDKLEFEYLTSTISKTTVQLMELVKEYP